MKQGPQLQLRQSQQMAMTPQLQQSLKMLQMNSVDLMQAVMEEIEQNPLLSLDEAGETQQQEPENEIASAPESEGVSELSGTLPEQQDNIVDAWEGGGEEAQPYRTRDSDEDSDFINQTVAKPQSLKEHLEQQIALDFEDPVERLIGLQLLDYIEPSGYLSPEYIAVSKQLGCTEGALEKVISQLQKMDPLGIFARNLAECLTIQLRELDRLDPAMQAMMENLELIAQADFKKLSKLCGVGEEDIREMCQELRALNPKPAQHFEHSTTENWQPDVLVRRMGGGAGGYRVELNPDTMPRVLFHRAYYAEITGKTRDKTERKTLTEYAQSANWLVRSLEQRAQSILKVASEIVVMQEEFLEKGVYYLKPMTLKAVAERVELHESTVGRVVNGKYMSTPKGVFEFRYFFSSAVGAGDATNGEDLSSRAIKQLIKELIEGEAANNILSDDAIAGAIKDKGMEVARRTIAKYRESMNIASSSERRRAKKIQAATNG